MNYTISNSLSLDTPISCSMQSGRSETSTDSTTHDVPKSDYNICFEDDEFMLDDNNNNYVIIASLFKMNDNITFQNNGYNKIHKICDTLQGKLYKASKVNDPQSYVAIKKTNKLLFAERIAIENGFNFCVSENILKETLILQYLTVDNQPIGDYIVKYIDFFETETDYYLVMEYIESEMNLKQFISRAHQYIKCGTLSLKEYKKMIKYLLWQLFVTVQWLHSMNCTHLDLCLENIMLKNGHFIPKNNGHFAINPNICIALTDFGVAEIFDDGFACEKQGLSIFNEGYFAPEVFNGDTFDARAADNWCLGMILFQCMTVGEQLYTALNMYNHQSGYIALFDDTLRQYLGLHNMLKHFNMDSFALLNSLLNVNEAKRLHGMSILKHSWFRIYYKRYKKQIATKFKHKRCVIHYTQFPFYRTNGI